MYKSLPLLLALILTACSSAPLVTPLSHFVIDSENPKPQRLITPVYEVECWTRNIIALSSTVSEIEILCQNQSGIFSPVAYDFKNPYLRSAITPAQGGYRSLETPRFTPYNLNYDETLSYQERTQPIYFQVRHYGRPYRLELDLYGTAMRTVF